MIEKSMAIKVFNMCGSYIPRWQDPSRIDSFLVSINVKTITYIKWLMSSSKTIYNGVE
jgi:hypothetical protein